MTEQEIQAMTKLVIENQDKEKEEFLKRKIEKTIDFIEELKIDFLCQMHAFCITRPEIKFDSVIEYASQSIDITEEALEVAESQIVKLTDMLNSLKAEHYLSIMLYNELNKS